MVSDDDVPEISVTKGADVAEGTAASFTVSANPAPAAPLTVKLTVTQTGDYVATSNLNAQTVTVPKSGSKTYTVGTVEDSVDEADGSVTVTVDAGQGYTVAKTPANAATVVVSDDDVPEISVTKGADVTEGTAASFTISASPTPAAPLTVKLTVTQTGDYLAPTAVRSDTVTVPTSGSKTYTVGTVDDSVDEADGSVTVTLKAGQGYTVAKTPANAATVAVSDDDVPEVSIAGLLDVTEGAPARFRLTASPAPAAALTVKLTVAQTGDYVDDDDLGSQTVSVPTGGAVIYEVDTDGDDADEADGSVTVTLNAGEGYTVADSPNNAGSVDVSDDDVPQISVTKGADVTEATAARFTISASPKPAAALTVKFRVTQSGDYVATDDRGNKTVTVPTSGSVTHEVPTKDDIVDEADGSVTVTLRAGTGYTVANSPNNAATVAVSDDDVLLISVSAGSGVTEGTEARFTVSASPRPAAPLTVKFTVTQSGDYVDSDDLGSKTVTVPTSGSVTYDVDTDGDDADEADGSVTVTLNAGEGYTVANSPNNAASVAVSDDDDSLPEISVEAGDAVTEGAAASFTITADPAPAADLTVKLRVETTGAFVVGKHKGSKTVTVPTGGSVTHEVPTKPDSDDEPNGSVTVTIRAGQGYEVADEPDNAATVTVNDDDDPIPEISVEAGDAVTEGAAASFTITADPAPASALEVKIDLTAQGNVVTRRNLNRKKVTIPTAGSLTFTVKTEDDRVDEAAGSVKLALKAGNGYTVAKSPADAAEVTVNDDDPTVSVTAGNTVREGTAASFTISASPKPASALTVEFTVTQTGGFADKRDEGAKTVDVPTSGSVVYEVPTLDDNVDEPAGSVTVTLDEVVGYGLGTDSEATVAVQDNERTVVSLAVPAGAVAENRGTKELTFTLTHTLATGARIELPLKVAGATAGTHYTLALKTGQGVNTGVTLSTSSPHSAQNPALVFAAGARVATLVLTALPNMDTTMRTVSVECTDEGSNGRRPKLQGSGGGGITRCRTASVVIADDDAPTVSVAAGPTVTEGTAATFTVTATPAPSSALTVNLTVAHTGAHVASGNVGTGKTVTVSTAGTGTFTVPTVGDSTDEQAGLVTVTLEAGSTYHVAAAPDNAASVIVNDDDTGPLDPEVSVEAVNVGGRATEGSPLPVIFRLRVAPSPAQELTVQVKVTQTGDFVAPENIGTVEVKVPRNTQNVRFNVPVEDDSVDEPAGKVTATVLPSGTIYKVAGAPDNDAEVTVADDEPTIVTLAAASGGIAEAGGSKEITITSARTLPAGATITVPLTLTGATVATHYTLALKTGQGVNTGVTLSTSSSHSAQNPAVVLGAGAAVATLLLTAVPNSDSDSRTVSVTYGTGSRAPGAQGIGGGGIAPTGAAAVAITDDENASQSPVVSVTAGPPVTEGAAASYIITANPAPTSDLTVTLTVAQTGNYGDPARVGANKTVTVPASGSVAYTVGTVDDADDEADGSVSVTVVAGSGYRVTAAANSTASVSVRDNDELRPPTELSMVCNSGPELVASWTAVNYDGDYGGRYLVFFGQNGRALGSASTSATTVSSDDRQLGWPAGPQSGQVYSVRVRASGTGGVPSSGFTPWATANACP